TFIQSHPSYYRDAGSIPYSRANASNTDGVRAGKASTFLSSFVLAVIGTALSCATAASESEQELAGEDSQQETYRIRCPITSRVSCVGVEGAQSERTNCVHDRRDNPPSAKSAWSETRSCQGIPTRPPCACYA